MLIEELIEKAFCDGYEYAQKEFGKDKKDDLKGLDKVDHFIYKNLTTKRGRQYYRNTARGKEDDYLARIPGAISTIPGAALGFGLGKAMGKSNAKSAAIAGLAGAAMGATTYGAGVLGNKSGIKLQKKLKEKSKKYQDDWKKQEDLIDLAEGKISKEEFIKKHYK
jgi:hypothetical protein